MSKDSTTSYKVINHEEQYSLWPTDSENPRGWKDVGKVGSPRQCLNYIEEVWTDMRPLSLRNKGASRNPKGLGDKSDGVYKIVINHEEQWSFLPVETRTPLGWKNAGKTCSAPDCLNRLREIWTE